MQSRILAIRAITAEYVRQMLHPLLLPIGAALGGVMLTSVFLALQFSPWWWLLTIPVVILTSIMVTIWLLVRFIIARLSPKLNDTQRDITVRFASKAQIVTGTLTTPYFLIVFYVIRDVVLRRNFEFIEVLATDTTVLRSDFEKLQKTFQIEK